MPSTPPEPTRSDAARRLRLRLRQPGAPRKIVDRFIRLNALQSAGRAVYGRVTCRADAMAPNEGKPSAGLPVRQRNGSGTLGSAARA
jgi:hypothetical protein